MKHDRPIVLASASPRRQQLLGQLVPTFEIVTSNVDEEALTSADPFETAETLAKAKALAVLELRPHALVIGGDTVVALPDGHGGYMQLAKPTSDDHAMEMLGLLSGKEHLVITGICIASTEQTLIFSDTTKVSFREITQKEIRAYVATGIPKDKAGGYAIQEGADKFVTSVTGSISNVIGLPIEKLQVYLSEIDK